MIIKSALLLLLATLDGLCLTQVTGTSTRASGLDISKTDIFALKEWNSLDVVVSGIGLGMPREAVEQALRAQGAIINAKLCVSDPCVVVDQNKIPTGIELRFSMKGQLIEISIVPWPGEGPQPNGYITETFKGDTSDLVNHYNETLRVALLGRENERWQEIHERYDSFVSIKEKYRYDRGLIIKISQYKATPDESFASTQVERLEFILPASGRK